MSDGVTIKRRALPDASAPGKLKVVSVLVYELKPQPNEMWQIAGSATLGTLTYGITPKGMQNVIAAKPLEPGHGYVARVEVKCPGLFSPDTCPGEVIFTVLADGSVKEGHAPPEQQE